MAPSPSDEREKRMGYSRTGWAAGTIAPWCLGMALAVSMSADAGQEAASGASFAPLPLRAPAPPAVLVPARPPALGLDFGEFPGEARKILREASLSIGGREEFKRLPDEIEPRTDLKRDARRFPEVDRSNKGESLGRSTAGIRHETSRFSRPREFPRRRPDFPF